MDRAEKEQQIEELGKHFAKSAVAYCANYRGLSVTQITDLRRELKRSGAVGYVVKNTLAKVSVDRSLTEADEQQREKLKGLFEGPSFLVFSPEDPASPAKILKKFSENHECFELKGGWFEGGFVDVEGVKNLSSLPSREELYSKLLSIFNAPATKVVQLLQAPASQLVRTLEAYRAKLEG
ncbi:MAG: 50S ribosomal protein L10 [Bdellovibrionales bacterium]|nr:50S ribosomal protein L10 [Bdellovibrionales bacterium]